MEKSSWGGSKSILVKDPDSKLCYLSVYSTSPDFTKLNLILSLSLRKMLSHSIITHTLIHPEFLFIVYESAEFMLYHIPSNKHWIFYSLFFNPNQWTSKIVKWKIRFEISEQKFYFVFGLRENGVYQEFEGEQDMAQIFKVVYKEVPGLREERVFGLNDERVVKTVGMTWDERHGKAGEEDLCLVYGCFCCVGDEEEDGEEI